MNLVILPPKLLPLCHLTIQYYRYHIDIYQQLDLSFPKTGQPLTPQSLIILNVYLMVYDSFLTYHISVTLVASKFIYQSHTHKVRSTIYKPNHKYS
jgi:hypothetical protein